MTEVTEAGTSSRLVLISVAVALIIAGCATTASFRPEIDSLKAALAEAKAAGAETLAPEEYAHAEACLDWLTHEATELNPFADPDANTITGKCRAAIQALKSRMAAVREAKALAPVTPVPPPPPAAEAPPPPAKEAPPPPAVTAEPAPAVPEPDKGVYPAMGTLAEALVALPQPEAPPAVTAEPAPAAPETPWAAVEAPAAPAPPAPPSPMAPPPAADVPPPSVAAAPTAAKEKVPSIGDIFFDYDESVIRPDAQKTLDENIQWLRANPKPSFVIEGHCDERGTLEYNLGLGQRRAKAAMDYLVAAGIEPGRITIISYGKERPFVVGHDESAWKWNRRAHFVLR